LQPHDHPFFETIGFSHTSNIHQDLVKKLSLDICCLQENILIKTKRVYIITKDQDIERILTPSRTRKCNNFADKNNEKIIERKPARLTEIFWGQVWTLELVRLIDLIQCSLWSFDRALPLQGYPTWSVMIFLLLPGRIYTSYAC
jgi:hypothetical protein